MTNVNDISTDSIEFNSTEIAERRLALWYGGYRPVTLYSNDKRPVGNGWDDHARLNPPSAVSAEPFAAGANTGILADGLRAVDIDVDDPARAEALDRLATDMLGAAPMRGREGSPRHTWLYRAAEGQPHKRSVVNRTTEEKVEVLGYGNQFMAHGVHPSGASIRWQGLCDRDLLTAVTEEQIGAFLSAAAKLIGATDAHDGGFSNTYWSPESLEAVDIPLMARVYDAMPNKLLWNDRTEWIKLAHATKAAFRQDEWRGQRLFLDHAARWKGGKVSEGEAKRVWDSLSKDHRVGAGYIIDCARKLDVDRRVIADYEMAVWVTHFECEPLPADYNEDPTRHPQWESMLSRNQAGFPKSNLMNCDTTFRKCPAFARVFKWNEFALAIEIHSPTPWENDREQPIPRALSEGDLLCAQRFLQQHEIGVSKETAMDGIRLEALRHNYHPVKQYLYSLRWDGVARVDQWLHEHLGAENNELNRALGSKWLIAGVARVMQPGCKVDNCLILEGAQDVGKSTALATLAGRPEWFTDHLPDLHSKEVARSSRRDMG
jgi:hypothetical protein